MTANQVDSALNELNGNRETTGCEVLCARHMDKLAVDLPSIQISVIGAICGFTLSSLLRFFTTRKRQRQFHLIHVLLSRKFDYVTLNSDIVASTLRENLINFRTILVKTN